MLSPRAEKNRQAAASRRSLWRIGLSRTTKNLIITTATKDQAKFIKEALPEFTKGKHGFYAPLNKENLFIVLALFKKTTSANIVNDLGQTVLYETFYYDIPFSNGVKAWIEEQGIDIYEEATDE